MHFINFNTVSTFSGVCVLPLDGYQKMGLSLLTPFLFFVELFITAFIHRLSSAFWNPVNVRLRFQPKLYWRSLFGLYLYSYTQFASVSFDYLVIVGTC